MSKKFKASGPPLKIDLHLHSKGSFDSQAEPKDIVQAALDAKLDGLVVTDHHYTHNAGSVETLELARQAGLICFLGCEYSSLDGHVLVYGVDIRALRLGMYETMQEVATRALELGGVAVPAHPHSPRSKGVVTGRLHTLRGLITTIESPNGELARSGGTKNASALAEGAALGLATTGGSDAHYASRVGATYTEIAGPLQYEWDLVQALLEGRCKGVVNADKPVEKWKAPQYDWEQWRDKKGAKREAKKQRYEIDKEL